MGRYFLAVDGGGSTTEFCVSDENGSILYFVTSGPSSHKAVGKEAAFNNLREGLRALEKKGVHQEEFIFSVWGLSGFDTPKDGKIQSSIITKLGFTQGNFLLCNDSLFAFYAVAMEPGMVIISGTGSIACGINKDYTVQRSGGWGYSFSDQGSGRWIGNEALKETLLYCDGIRTYDPLFEAVRIECGAENFEVLPYQISDIISHDKIATFARIVLNNKEYPMCRDIIDKATTRLTDLGVSLFRKMGSPKDDEFKIVLAGGIMSQKHFREKIVEKLHSQTNIPKENIVPLKASPVEGGIRIALSRQTFL